MDSGHQNRTKKDIFCFHFFFVYLEHQYKNSLLHEQALTLKKLYTFCFFDLAEENDFVLKMWPANVALLYPHH